MTSLANRLNCFWLRNMANCPDHDNGPLICIFNLQPFQCINSSQTKQGHPDVLFSCIIRTINSGCTAEYMELVGTLEGRAWMVVLSPLLPRYRCSLNSSLANSTHLEHPVPQMLACVIFVQCWIMAYRFFSLVNLVIMCMNSLYVALVNSLC